MAAVASHLKSLSSYDPASEIRALKCLLASLLNIDPDKLGFDVSYSGPNILIEANDETLALRLRKLLDSPMAVRNNLAYVVSKVISPSDKEHKESKEESDLSIQMPKAMTLKPRSGALFFNKILSGVLGESIGLIKWTGEFGVDCVLYAEYDEIFAGLRSEQIKLYQKSIQHATFLQLRKAIAETDGAPLPDSVLSTKVQGPLYNQAGKIFTQRVSSGKLMTQFDYGLLYRCLVAPEIQVRPSADKILIEFSKRDFLCFLSSLFQEGFVLHLEKLDLEQRAYPICFNTERSIPLDISLSIIQDCSGSMSPDLKQCIEILHHFTEELRTKFSKTNLKLRLLPFSTKGQHPTLECDLSEKGRISKFLNEIELGGDTYLFGTVLEECQHVKKQLDRMTSSILILSDGQNNIADELLNDLQIMLRDFKNMPNPPRIFVYGLRDYDKRLDELAVITGGAVTKLSTIHDLNAALSHLEDLEKSRLILRFIQKNKSFDVPVYEGRLSMASSHLAMGESFSAAGELYSLLNQIPASQLLAAVSASGDSKAGSPILNAFGRRDSQDAAPSSSSIPEDHYEGEYGKMCVIL